MPDVTLLIVTPGLLNTQHLESRQEIDTSQYTFYVSNSTTSWVQLTNIQLYLIFDFTNQDLTINGVSQSTLDDPLILDVDDLIPEAIQSVSVTIVANVGGTPSPVQAYLFTILATYDTEPFPAIDGPSSISGGLQLFNVVPD